MTATTYAAPQEPRGDATPEAGQRLLLQGVTWESYADIGRALRDRSNLRLTYDRGELELMTLSAEHEKLRHRLGRFLEILAEELGLPLEPGGSMTFRRSDLSRALEPDECFWIAHEARVRGKLEWDPETDPPPDLVLEIEVSRSALDRIGIYAALGVPEVWCYDREDLRILCLQGDGTYARSGASPTMPGWRSQRSLASCARTRRRTTWARCALSGPGSASSSGRGRSRRQARPGADRVNALGAEELARLRELRELRDRIDPETLTQAELERERAFWAPRVAPDPAQDRERSSIARPDGSTTGVSGPRWLFHLLGLPHRSVHVGLFTPGGLVILQRRSRAKADYPDAWDTTASGHVPVGPDGRDLSYGAGAFKEVAEELGLPQARLPDLLVGRMLASVGEPYRVEHRDETRSPPLDDREVIRLFAGVLTGAGLARLRLHPEELAGIYLCTPAEAAHIRTRPDVAPGLPESLGRLLEWISTAPAPDDADPSYE